MLICVDGTGRADNKEYKERMKDGFVRTIALNARVSHIVYRRGPDWKGFGAKLADPISFIPIIKSSWDQGDRRLFMAGYSRGGAIVINIASLLSAHNIEVEALFLFDAVDRSVKLDAAIIPGNVKHTYHALRKPSARSRESFGNCGLRQAGRGVYEDRRFKTTHGALGGVPWKDRGLEPAFNRALGMIMPCDPLRSSDPNCGRTALNPPPMNAAERYRLEVAKERIRAEGYIDEGGLDGATRVTAAEELAGMRSVRDWMWPHLRKHGVLN